MLRITQASVFFPGGYVYRQPETGFTTGGNNSLKQNAKLLLSHRNGNHLPGATIDECTNDIVAACCRRYPKLCTEVGAVVFKTIRITPVSTPVPTAKMTVRRTGKCGSCGGRKAKK